MRMARRCPDWIAREDLVAAGMLGLTEAAERYDSTRNEPFLSFAEKRIRGAVLDELRRGDIMPRRTRQLARKIGKTIQEVERATCGPATDEAVASALGVSLDEYKTDLEQLVHVTVGVLDEVTGEGVVAPTASPESEAARREATVQVCRRRLASGLVFVASAKQSLVGTGGSNCVFEATLVTGPA
jgi:RNA polymerase sigma factor for flagellar operon FliA